MDILFIRKLLTAFPIGSDFVLAVADQVPLDASLARMRMVRELINYELPK